MTVEEMEVLARLQGKRVGDVRKIRKRVSYEKYRNIANWLLEQQRDPMEILFFVLPRIYEDFVTDIKDMKKPEDILMRILNLDDRMSQFGSQTNADAARESVKLIQIEMELEQDEKK